MKFLRLLGAALGALLLTIVATAQDAPGDGFAPVEQLRIEVLNEYPHDPEAFTQGLLFSDDGVMYESTGRYGESTLRSVDETTGEVIRRYALPENVFAEGLALYDNNLFQITWRAQTAIVYDVATGEADDTFEPLGVFNYNGEGWGLCAADDQLYMSNGSYNITVRNPVNFQPSQQYPVTLYGTFVDEINELECVGDHIYANIWQSDTIIRFDRETGVVDAVIDARDLLPPEVRAGYESAAVLNGIAYNPQTETFFITGKLWETMFEVEFVPAG